MPRIHPTAIVDSQAQLADDVEIGPYAILEGRVEVGAGSVIRAHSIIQGHTVIGMGCQIGPAAYLGGPPQHLASSGEGTSLVIGEQTVVRETATIHRAIHPGIENATRIGKRCFIMAAVHIGHDCVLHDEAIAAGGALLGGHCIIGARAFLGGGSAYHQFVQIGRLVVISGNEAVTRDVLPFAAVRYDGIKGYNAVGCRRAGMSRSAIASIRQALACFHEHRTTPAAVAAVEREVPMTDEVREILAFVAGSKRGLHPSVRFAAQRGARGGGDDSD
jgi:UDP-N-acetylglucosamine acyltransferase